MKPGIIQTSPIIKLELTGDIPQARFGHTITPIGRNRVLLFGGATGDTGKYSITGDTYILNEKNWTKLEASGTAPSPRAAHSATAVDTLQVVIYGGATGGGALASDDLYLLDLRQEVEKAVWMIVPVVGSTPGRRYGHTLIFAKPFLLVFGGNTGSEPVNDTWILNVEKSPFSWQKLELGSEQPLPRVYHSASLCQTGSATGMMVIYGGRTTDQSALNDCWGLRRHRNGSWDWVRAPSKPGLLVPTCRYQHSSLFIGAAMCVLGGRTNNVGEVVSMEVYDTETSEWIKFPPIKRFRHASWTQEGMILVHGGFEHETPNIPTDMIVQIDTWSLFQGYDNLLQKFNTAVVPTTPNLPSAYIEQDIQQQPKVKPKVDIVPSQKQNKVVIRELDMQSQNQLCDMFIKNLLKPKEWSAAINSKFAFPKQHIYAITEECENYVKAQPMVIRLRSPVKIFGDIHGQYNDLMRFFDLYGAPIDNKHEGGDLEGLDYLFIGDFVDRGSFSLETICLLMALKCKYPDQIHLIRGNHEDKWINQAFGFADECQVRLGEDPTEPKSIFNRINKMFEHLPLSAIIDDKICCIHGGIGSTLHTIDQIERLPRPLDVIHEVTTEQQQLVVDILWSDPTDTDQELGIQANIVRDPNGTGNIVKFGPDRVKEFLKKNNLNFIIRAHECVMDGFERFAGGDLITIFSATDYCGRHKNAGAILVVKKNFQIQPKLIYPIDNPFGSNWIEDQEALKRRPPTPPRWRQAAGKRSAYE